MTAAPTPPTIPSQQVTVDSGNQVTPVWYEYFSGLVKMYKYLTTLQPLSDLQATLDSKSDLLRTINNQTGTTYTFALSDNGAYVRFSNASAITVTIPSNASVALPVGAQIDVFQKGVGKVTFVGAVGVSINSAGSWLSLSSQGAGGSWVKVDTNEWDFVGNIAT
ncbi:MAG: hypothetical protein EKK40_07050 [Bradyrhizobiaceae bacterium]|nr:MAG: hypothetical protein EKK40_07050 [Bradyrhizobiaceae bacterium]